MKENSELKKGMIAKLKSMKGDCEGMQNQSLEDEQN